jgi:hypothetical protein
LNISFAPTPDYAGIAYAASGRTAWAGTAGSVADLERLLPSAVEAVLNGRTAVLDAHLGGSVGKFIDGTNSANSKESNGQTANGHGVNGLNGVKDNVGERIVPESNGVGQPSEEVAPMGVQDSTG